MSPHKIIDHESCCNHTLTTFATTTTTSSTTTMGRKQGIGRQFKKTKPQTTEGSTSSASKAPKTKPKKKDAPTGKDAKAEDPHEKKPAGRKPPLPASKKPSTTDKPARSRRTKNKKVKESIPLLFQRMSQLMEVMNNPSMVESIVNHFSTWKPFESPPAVKAPPDATKATTTMESAVTEAEEQINEPGGETTTAESVGMEKQHVAEPTATDEASMETSSAEAPPAAPTTAEKETAVEVPMLTRCTGVAGNELTPLDKHAFGLKRDSTRRKGVDICGHNRSATKAKNRAASSMTTSILKPSLKEMCCCRICESMNFKQDTLNMWRRKKKKELRVKWEELPEGPTRSQRDAKSAAAEELALFMAEGFSVDEDLHPTASATALSIQCAPPAEFEGSGLTKLKCASSSVISVLLSRGLLLNCLLMTILTL